MGLILMRSKVKHFLPDFVLALIQVFTVLLPKAEADLGYVGHLCRRAKNALSLVFLRR